MVSVGDDAVADEGVAVLLSAAFDDGENCIDEATAGFALGANESFRQITEDVNA
jgi:hypothetical protein